jgi:mono/diheme cytochrome c family protein
VKSVEFISWNSNRLRFDFGIIECGENAEVRLLDGVKCFSCHKNRGPILGPNPWSNTAANPQIQNAAVAMLRVPDSQVKPPPFMPPGEGVFPGFAAPPLKIKRIASAFEGTSLTVSQGVEVDGSVQQGADLLHDREMFRFMNRTPDGRKAFVMLLTAIALPGSLDAVDKDLMFKLNDVYTSGFPQFRTNWAALQKTTQPSMLIDFNPVASITPSAGLDPVQYYDSRRALGDHGMPNDRRPSNPKAFMPPSVKPPAQPSAVLSATLLAQTIGLTEGDREFFAESVRLASNFLEKSQREIAEEVFKGPSFADVLAGGPLPDREEFKARFFEGVMAPLKKRGYENAAVRTNFASAPVPSRDEKDVVEPVLVPTTRCQGCHDIRGSGKAAGTEPIPALLFDPFDKESRETWLKTADKNTKVRFLTKMLKRLGEEKDMPPEDSAEFELFRTRDPAAFEAVKMFLEAELRKAKGG